MTAHHTCTDTCKQDDYFHRSMRGEDMTIFEKELRRQIKIILQLYFKSSHYETYESYITEIEACRDEITQLVIDTVLKALGEPEVVEIGTVRHLASIIRNEFRAKIKANLLKELGIKEK